MLLKQGGRTFRVKFSPRTLLLSAILFTSSLYLFQTLTSAPVAPKFVRDWREEPDTPGLTFRDKFKLWDEYKAPPVGADVWQGSDRSLIYRCDTGLMSRCGGFADRLKAITVAYVLANLTRRSLKVEIYKPACDFRFYLAPNKYNWLVPEESVSYPQPANILRLNNNFYFKYAVPTANFEDYFKPELKDIYFHANLEYMNGLRHTQVYQEQLSWMRAMSPADIYAAIYKRLFKLAPRLNTQLQALLDKHLTTPKSRLVCSQIRMGRNPSIKGDTEVRGSLENVEKFVWPFLKNQVALDTDVLFIATDSQEVHESAKRQPFSDRLLEIPGPIAHIDLSKGLSFDEMWAAQDKLLLEFHLLMNCDVLVKGVSGLGDFASFIRGSDEGLYCLHKNGTVTPCQRNDLTYFL